ncbi:vancomycin resistance protein, partial [Clostridium tarantellae]|nr:vancomycin resistance protein [Clostridium tarantellae]
MKQRKLFCEISPLTYKISSFKEQVKRHIQLLIDNN